MDHYLLVAYNKIQLCQYFKISHFCFMSSFKLSQYFLLKKKKRKKRQRTECLSLFCLFLRFLFASSRKNLCVNVTINCNCKTFPFLKLVSGCPFLDFQVAISQSLFIPTKSQSLQAFQLSLVQEKLRASTT